MYLVDANVLIEAKNRYYAFDIAPGFWKWLELSHEKSLVCSIEAVRDELLRGDDELSMWAQKHTNFFKPISKAATEYFTPLTEWAASCQYTPAALANFTGTNADFLLIAFAKAHMHTVITHERSQPNSRKRILIPDACTAMGVVSLDTFQMLRDTGARLDLR